MIKLIMFLTLLSQLQSENTQCKIKYDLNVYFQYSENSIIILSQEDNFEDITNVGYELLNQTFKINFNQDLTIYSILRSNKYFKIIKEEQYIILQRLCVLAKLHENISNQSIYLIGCTFMNFRQESKQFNFHFNHIEQKLEIQTVDSEACTNVFEISKNKLIIFCSYDKYFTLIEIDEEFKISTIIKKEITELQRDCQINIIQSQNELIISLQRCNQWIIYILNEQLNLSILLDKEFINQYLDFQIYTKLINVQVCQKRIFYIFQNGYFYKNNKGNKSQHIYSGDRLINNDETLEYLVFRRCYYLYKIVSIDNKIYISENDQKYYLGTSDIKFSQCNGFLIIIQEEQITLFITQKIQYTYYLNQTEMKQIKFQIPKSNIFQNIIYEINNFNKKITFFQFQFQSYLKQEHKYNYFYVFSYSDTLENPSCLKIYVKYDQNIQNDVKYLDHLSILDNQVEKYLLLDKNNYLFEQLYDIKLQEYYASNKTIFISVFDKFEIKEKCQSNILYDKDSEMINIKQFNEIVVIKKQQSLLLINCDNNQQKFQEINIPERQVFIMQGLIILIGTESQEIQIYSIQGNFLPFKTLNFNGIIDRIDLFPQYILVYIENYDTPFILNLNSVFQPLYQPLQLENELYINQNIKFYFQDSDIILIQYHDLFIIKNELDIQISQLHNITIFLIIKELNFHLVFGVHDYQQILKLYFFKDFELIEIYNHTLDEYVLIRPIKYQILNKNIILLVKKQQNFHLLMFSYNNFNFQLKQDIQTSRQVFFVLGYHLIYYNFQDIIEVFDSSNIHIKLNFLSYKNYNFLDLIQFKFIIESKKAVEVMIQQAVDISIVNFQQHIKTLNQSLYLTYEQTAINLNDLLIKIPFNPLEYFEGQILNFQFVSYEAFINGPIISDFSVMHCNFTTCEICIRQKTLNIKNQQIQINEIVENENDNIINIFSLENRIIQYKLIDGCFLIILEEMNQFFGIIFNNDNATKNYVQTQELLLNNLSVYKMEKIQIIQKESTFLIEQENQLKTMLYFNGLNFSEVKLPDNILDVCHVENTEQIYLYLYYQQNMTLEFQLIEMPKQKIIFSINIHQSQIIQNENFFTSQEVTELIKFYKLISCEKINNILKIKLIQFTPYFAQIIKQEIDCQSLITNFQFEKKLKILPNKQMRNYQLFGNHLFGTYNDDSTSYYDLSTNQEYNDFILIERHQRTVIQQLNSTHFHFFKKDNQYIGRLGFELQFILNNETEIKTQLFASNHVSKASIDIFLNVKKNLKNVNHKSLELQIFLFAISLIMIFFCIFIFRRKNLMRNFHQTKTYQHDLIN